MLIVNNKALKITNKWLNPIAGSGPTPPGPTPPGPTPTLPAYTLRLKFTDGVTPTFTNGTATQVSSSPNIWDLTYENEIWYNLLYNQTDLLEVIAAGDTSGVTNMNCLFQLCTALTTVPLFDTSNVTGMNSMFSDCTSLTNIPLFDTSKVNQMSGTFAFCWSVQSGALALYNQVSSQTTPPTQHYSTFRDCGVNTTTGAAELAQIPSDWK